MPSRQVHLEGEVPGPLVEGLNRLRAEVGLDAELPAAVVHEAAESARNPRLPSRDLTDVEFVTIDPPGAMDLDQAVHIARQQAGWLVRYAIADVPAFVRPGGAVDAHAHAQGQTLYAPHRRYPLHPPVLSEAAASLLPGQDRPAQVWEISVDADGAMTSAIVHRAMVRSRAKLDYARVQKAIDARTAAESLMLLRDVGRVREEREVQRGGVNLSLPDQEVRVTEGGRWRLDFRSPLPVEGWNAQISLLTGMAAADMMVDAEVGLLRTLPRAGEKELAKLRRTAGALGIAWPADTDYPQFVRSLDADEPSQAAMLYACTSLFRGADYQAFDGEVPELRQHAALANEYAHVTAPLRRLVDRYAGEICLAVCAGERPPQWVLDALDDLPADMRESSRRTRQFERGVLNLVEALILSGRVGQTLTGTVVELGREGDKATVVVANPAIEISVRAAGLALGADVHFVIDGVDLNQGSVTTTVTA